MSADRRPRYAVKSLHIDGRYLRWSWRYNTWQVLTRTHQWVNIKVPLARCYAAAGFQVSVEDTETPLPAQGQLFHHS